jgi:flagellar basal-body rod protein FlgG
VIQALYTAASGMTAQQKSMDVTANNIANINTTGYKSKTAGFKDAIYRTMHTPAEESAENNLQQGHGVLLSDIKTAFTQGPIEETGNPYDFAIFGTGFFAIETNEGIRFTRDGSFHRGETGFLLTKDGHYVLDSNRNRIFIPDNTNEDYPSPGVFEFTNPQGLSSEGANYYSETEVSGQAALSGNDEVRKGFLEASNIDTAEQLTRIIRSQRAYQVAARAITTADQMEEITNNIMR